jgi:hypothetical protein
MSGRCLKLPRFAQLEELDWAFEVGTQDKPSIWLPYLESLILSWNAWMITLVSAGMQSD